MSEEKPNISANAPPKKIYLPPAFKCIPVDADAQARFSHYENGPFSFDSVCLLCGRTVGTREREWELRVDEAVHVRDCSPLESDNKQGDHLPGA